MTPYDCLSQLTIWLLSFLMSRTFVFLLVFAALLYLAGKAIFLLGEHNGTRSISGYLGVGLDAASDSGDHIYHNRGGGMNNYTEMLPEVLKTLGWRLYGWEGYYQTERGQRNTPNFEKSPIFREMVLAVVWAYTASGLRRDGLQYHHDQTAKQASMFDDDKEG